MSKKQKTISQNHETENYSWGVIQDMIEKEINSAFKLRDDYTQILPSKKEIKKIIRDTVRKRREEKE